ncbi:unnamed protein product [Penicillium roqueforti FM164]|uniref:Uncharacterized protein n=1 Tax=Penicillium roqueforti (strain FM164) TaxID=1365484 RepID=W6QUN0_PENRF|nr:unnamed protein product [Penicillium roqueforti FM164]
MFLPRNAIVLNPTLNPTTCAAGCSQQAADFPGRAKVNQDWHSTTGLGVVD